MAIVMILEFGDGGAQLLNVPEDAAMDDLCSFSVRLNRSATPLVWGSATKAKLGAMPENLTWLRKPSAFQASHPEYFVG